MYRKSWLLVVLLTIAPLMMASGQSFAVDPAAQLLKDKLSNNYRSVGPVGSINKALMSDEFDVKPFGRTSWASREYLSNDGESFSVILITTSSDSGAYSNLTHSRRRVQKESGGAETHSLNVGTADFWYWDGLKNHLTFIKGKACVSVWDDGKSRDTSGLKKFALTLAETLDNGEGEIPVLVKHLPDWENVQHQLSYVITERALRDEFPQSVFSAVSFAGGAEAAIADYQGTRLVLIEFNTPQIATDNNQRIVAKINELRDQGQSAPSAYRRVGNYSVFVFNAADEQAANELIDQVKYQQVVQWLGKNPYLYDEAANEFTQTTLGVFVAVVKASGLALIITLAIGGLVGAVLFSIRRSQKQALEAYSDAGGMLRLNLDEITPTTDPSRLLGPGN